VERGGRPAVGALPPGPASSPLSRLAYWPGRDPLGFFSGLKKTYGDVVHVRLGGERVFVLSDPRDIRDVLVTHQASFAKGRGLERARRLLGQGLLTSEGATHVRQRRLMQPAFHRDRVSSYASVMTAYAQRLCDAWTDGATVDAAQEMNRLALAIVGKTLFDADVEAQAVEVGDALTDVMNSFWTIMLPWSDLIERLPLPAIRRGRRARERLDAIIYGMIAERRRSPRDRGDLLSMLLLAQDVDGDGTGMSDQQVRDEAMTIFLAGHETTANALAWTWYLLSESPDAERRLHEEVDRVLGGRLPEVADLPAVLR
jgi:cytochrome P450